MPRRMKPKRVPRFPLRNPANTMMKGMVDMGTMAVGGLVAVGTINAVGSILKK